MTMVHGSKPLMDLLVMLCAKYHLNPSSHTLELVTTNRNNIKLKPNALIGTLDAEKIILKPKGEDKNKKTGPQMPEATVRMVINYKQTQKTILRVSPRVALAELLPAICEKCEFDTETTVLLKDAQSLAPLDLSSSLNDYAIREVYARDTKGPSAYPGFPPSHAGTVIPGKDKYQKEKENKGLLGMFRKSKKRSDEATTASAPASPVLSCTSDHNTRRRLYSEPSLQMDSDQMARLSRGSSAESSLKRTKRKAPPPPTSPGAVVHQTIPPEESLQGGTAANTLEEIMEQEETNALALSAMTRDTQGEDSSLSMSADVSLHSPSPDTEILSTKSVESSGEDQSHDLSSDGNELQSTTNKSGALTSVRTTAGTDSSELADTNCGLCKVENVSQQTICDEAKLTKGAGDDHGTGSSSLPHPVMQDAEAQANTETLWEPTERLESPLATSTSRPTGEDVQVQTDFTLAMPPQTHADKVPGAAKSTAFPPAGKKDMATLTDELDSPGPGHASFNTSETSSCQDSTPSAPVTTKAPPICATDSEPKPKPSNELTRDYIPKVGMTTYTIVPQKSLEKLRYFEVALTLEAPSAASKEGLNMGSLQLEESTAPKGQTPVSTEKSQLHSTIPRETY
ncbi:hypothetical protein Q5P01_013489 [Channa striata]|uniref:Cordon-bleu ubiquitin-like domain-containing protein n=1 Tax=Channa striata TaxID=64152 RepID=A0AA88MP70_CHASR|nr:hypothetical protein Q5P01_013489 [Channa striata]